MIPTTARAFGSPGRYVQGPGVLRELPGYAAAYGKDIYCIIDTFFYRQLSERFAEAFAQTGTTARFAEFGGEITEAQIRSLAARAARKPPDAVVGVGGGKALDAAKAVASRLGSRPVIVAPTLASCDAPASGVSILYNDAGEQVEIQYHKNNPALILADTAVIAKAPARYLAAGIGDAVATYFEGRANLEAGEFNFVGGWGLRPTLAGMLIAEGCRDINYRYGEAAMDAVRAGVVTEALENVVEANILLSGVGFENMAVAGAHSIQTGLSAAESGARPLHGEKVAFGLLCQLVLENRDRSEVEELTDFFHRIGLPLTLSDLGVSNDDETILRIANSALPCEWVHEPVVATAETLYSAIKVADYTGERMKRRKAHAAV